jgi:hypothetical protein
MTVGLAAPKGRIRVYRVCGSFGSGRRRVRRGATMEMECIIQVDGEGDVVGGVYNFIGERKPRLAC